MTKNSCQLLYDGIILEKGTEREVQHINTETVKQKQTTTWFMFDGTLVVRKMLNIRGKPVVINSSQ